MSPLKQSRPSFMTSQGYSSAQELHRDFNDFIQTSEK